VGEKSVFALFGELSETSKAVRYQITEFGGWLVFSSSGAPKLDGCARRKIQECRKLSTDSGSRRRSAGLERTGRFAGGFFSVGT
jgi:hypothetical protein